MKKIIYVGKSYHDDCIICKLQSFMADTLVKKLDKEIMLVGDSEKELKLIENDIKKKYSPSFIKKARKINDRSKLSKIS